MAAKISGCIALAGYDKHDLTNPPAMRLRLWRGWYAFPRAVGFIEDSNSKLYNALIHPKTFKVVE
jgi:hypothetical protein